MYKRPLPAAFISVAAVILIILGLRQSYSDPDLCLISYRTEPPVYVPLPVPASTSSNYALYLFRENAGIQKSTRPQENGYNLGETPVIFIPGNAGSYRQGLAFSSLASQWPEFDWFLVDFNEDMSALHGKTMVDEAVYVNEAIRYILSLYGNTVDSPAPESVIVVAHSMGGIVARTLVTLDNYLPKSVNTIFTFSTPHAQPPLTFDRDITQLYDVVGQWWRNQDPETAIQLVSVAGGHMDLLVPPGLTLADSFGGVSVLSYEVPEVGIGINHLAIVWCVQLRRVVIECLAEIADHSTPQRTLPAEKRRAVIQRRFKQLDSRGSIMHNVTVGPSILYGLSSSFEVPAGETSILLPARSSLVSYTVEVNEPVSVAHRTPLEYRSYGDVNKTTLIWTTAPPYVPFAKPIPPQLTLEITAQKAAKVKVSVNWPVTFANIAVYYRTISACWPFAAVLLAYLLNGLHPQRLTRMLVYGVAGAKFGLFALLLSAMHILLTFPAVRAAVRAVQFPSEAATVAGLQLSGYDAHDLLLGIVDPHLFWVAPVIFALACWVAAIMVLLTHIIVSCTTTVYNWVKSSRDSSRSETKDTSQDFGIKDISDSSDDTKEIRSELKSNAMLVSKYLRLLILFPILYVVPYQASTVALALIALLQLRSRDPRLAKVQLLLWSAVVDAPIVVVWLRNLHWDWLSSFASLRNMGAVLPIAIYVLYQPQNAPMQRVVKAVMLVQLGYTACYAVVYGGLHAFMIHYLTNFIILLELLLG